MRSSTQEARPGIQGTSALVRITYLDVTADAEQGLGSTPQTL